MKRLVISLCAVLGCLDAAIAQEPATSHKLIGGGSVSLRRNGDRLRVIVTGPRAGLASLCLADESSVRILHASAAVGQATYDKTGDAWALTERFDFKLRDTRSGPPPESDRRAFLDARGWVANANNAGTAPREFEIRLDRRAQFLGVAYYTTEAPEAISYWPEAIADDCRAVKVAQGFLPQTAQFRPSSWYRIP